MIVNYEESKDVFESLDDKDIFKMMNAAIATIFASEEPDFKSNDDVVDLVVVMKVLKVFLAEKHILQAGISGDWSAISFPDEEL